QGGDRPALCGLPGRLGGDQAQPRPARLGWLLPPWQLGAEVRPDRQLRPRAPGDLRQRQARPSWAQLATPLHLGVAEGPGGLSPQRTGAERSGACPAVNDVGKPCAGELHARFDRGPLADQAMRSRTPRTRGETRRTEPGHLQPGEPAAYLTTPAAGAPWSAGWQG